MPLATLRPTTQVVVHLNAADLIACGQGNPRGSAWIERAGHVTIETLTRMLRHSNITVKPVVDLNTLPVEDRYAPSAALREAVEYLFPTEAFPFATRSSRKLQLEHTQAWGTGPHTGDTELKNLAPLGIKAHRAKTAGYWTTRQVRPGNCGGKAPWATSTSAAQPAPPASTTTGSTPPSATARRCTCGRGAECAAAALRRSLARKLAGERSGSGRPANAQGPATLVEQRVTSGFGKLGAWTA